MTERKRINKFLCLVLFVAMVVAGKITVFAAGPIELENPTNSLKPDSLLDAAQVYTATFTEETEITFSSSYLSESTPINTYVYSDAECTNELYHDKWCDSWGDSKVVYTLPEGTYYFKVLGSAHTVKVSWAKNDPNKTFDTAKEISVTEGTDMHIDLGKNGEYWWVLKVPTPGKYTFKKDNAMSLWLMKGKESDTTKSMFEAASGSLQGSETFVLTPGEYTLCGRIGSSGTIDFTITNHTFNELTAMDGEAKVLMGAMSKCTYTLKLTPAVTDSTITAKTDLSSPFSITTVDKNTYVFESTSYRTGKGKVTFTSDDGFSKVVDVWVGPVASKVSSEGTHNSVTLKMQSDAGTKPQYVIYQLEGNDYKKVGSTSGESCTIKNLKPNGDYTFKVVAVDGDIEGGSTIHKAITAPNKKVTGIKVKCTKCKFVKGRKDTWEYSRFSGWYKVSHPARSYATVKVNYKKPKKASYVLVDGSKVKSGKTVSLSFYGKVKAGKKAKITFRIVREVNGSIAYGPTVTKTVKLKGAK